MRQAVGDVGGYPTNLVARLLYTPRSCTSRFRPERMRHPRSSALVFVPVILRLRPPLPLPRANLPAGLVVGLAGLARRALRLRHRLAGMLLHPLLRDRSANRRQLLRADVNGSVLDIGISAGELHRAAPQGVRSAATWTSDVGCQTRISGRSRRRRRACCNTGAIIRSRACGLSSARSRRWKPPFG